jgi:predicted S18 family serine protease
LAILGAIDRAARTAGLKTDSWTVSVAVHEPAGTIYGDSLSGMVGLTVLALAKGDFIPLDRTMTGTITPDGGIGPVSFVPLKIEAARRKHLRRVIIPDALDATDSDWVTPFLMQISPTHSAAIAYQALTDHSLLATDSVRPAR